MKGAIIKILLLITLQSCYIPNCLNYHVRYEVEGQKYSYGEFYISKNYSFHFSALPRNVSSAFETNEEATDFYSLLCNQSKDSNRINLIQNEIESRLNQKVKNIILLNQNKCYQKKTKFYDDARSRYSTVMDSVIILNTSKDTIFIVDEETIYME